MSWLSLLLLALLGGVILWLSLNAEARVLMRELGRYGLYRLASIVQNVSGRPIAYVERYKDSVARDAGLKTRHLDADTEGSKDNAD